jgi:hypothetical protein
MLNKNKKDSEKRKTTTTIKQIEVFKDILFLNS